MKTLEPTSSLDLQRSLSKAYRGVQGMGAIPIRTDAGIYLHHDASMLASQEEIPLWVKVQLTGIAANTWLSTILTMYEATGTMSLANIARTGAANVDIVNFDIWLLHAHAVTDGVIADWPIAALHHSPYKGKANAWGSGYAGDATRILHWANKLVRDVDNEDHDRFVADGTEGTYPQRLIPCRLWYDDVLRCTGWDAGLAGGHIWFSLLFSLTPKGILPASVRGS